MFQSVVEKRNQDLEIPEGETLCPTEQELHCVIQLFQRNRLFKILTL
jgi:hypothetical protein